MAYYCNSDLSFVDFSLSILYYTKKKMMKNGKRLLNRITVLCEHIGQIINIITIDMNKTHTRKSRSIKYYKIEGGGWWG